MAESTSIKLKDGLKDRIRTIAARENRTANNVMNEALNDYVERKEKRTAFLAEAEAAHRHYVETGLHVTQEEMDDWFDRIARGEEDPPLPEPHT